MIRDLLAVAAVAVVAVVGLFWAVCGAVAWYEAKYPCLKREPQMVCHSGSVIMVGKVFIPTAGSCRQEQVCVERAP